jgi:hypothetical protein
VFSVKTTSDFDIRFWDLSILLNESEEKQWPLNFNSMKNGVRQLFSVPVVAFAVRSAPFLT